MSNTWPRKDRVQVQERYLTGLGKESSIEVHLRKDTGLGKVGYRSRKGRIQV